MTTFARLSDISSRHPALDALRIRATGAFHQIYPFVQVVQTRLGERIVATLHHRDHRVSVASSRGGWFAGIIIIVDGVAAKHGIRVEPRVHLAAVPVAAALNAARQAEVLGLKA